MSGKEREAETEQATILDNYLHFISFLIHIGRPNKS